jgi:hypothetical protein
MDLRAKCQHCGVTVKKHLFIMRKGLETESRKEETKESTETTTSDIVSYFKIPLNY